MGSKNEETLKCGLNKIIDIVQFVIQANKIKTTGL